MNHRRSSPEPAPAAAELNEFLLELALALQRFAMYPGGHPTVDEAIARVAVRLESLLSMREMLSVGVARRQVVVEGIATSASHPVLRSLAERLHRHHLGAVVVRRGVTEPELRSALSAVAADADRTGALGAAPSQVLDAWPHVRFYRITYEQLQLADADDEIDGAEGTGSVRSSASVQLWFGLARAAMAQGEANDSAAEPIDGEPEGVARAINEHPAAQAYDQAITGYLLQLTEELNRSGDGRQAAGVKRRLSGMIRRLEPATLERLLRMGGDAAQRRRFVDDAVSSLQPDAVLEVLNAAAHAEGQSISTSMLRLLRKLSAHAADAQTGGDRADAEMREQVRSLLDGWTLTDPNPDAYTRALESMSTTTSGAAPAVSEHAPEPLRLLQMGVEADVTGVAFWRALHTLLEEGRIGDIFDVMDAAPAGNGAVSALWRRFESTDHIRLLLTTEPVDFEALDRIFERLPASTVISLLLDRLSESTSRTTRMGLYRRVSGRGYPAVPMIVERFADARWFVQRNLLALLGAIGSWPESFSPLAYTRHGQPMVRREAYPLAMQVASEREEAIVRALADTDERALRIGIAAARQHGIPRRAAAVVIRRVNDASLPEEIRVLLIRLAASIGGATAINSLVSLADGGRSLLGRPKLAVKSATSLAAIEALATIHASAAHAPDSRAAALLDVARSASDAGVRAAATVPSSTPSALELP